MLNKGKELQEGDYAAYGKCVNVTCGDPDTVVFHDGHEGGGGTKTTCEFIGRPSPLCSSNGVILVNLHGVGKIGSNTV